MLSDNRMELRKQLSAIHIMVEDLGLYLNTHPYDQEALEARNVYAKSYRDLQEEYNQCFGMYTQDDISSCPWQWIEEPWPWECEANFKL